MSHISCCAEVSHITCFAHCGVSSVVAVVLLVAKHGV